MNLGASNVPQIWQPVNPIMTFLLGQQHMEVPTFPNCMVWIYVLDISTLEGFLVNTRHRPLCHSVSRIRTFSKAARERTTSVILPAHGAWEGQFDNGGSVQSELQGRCLGVQQWKTRGGGGVCDLTL